MRLISKVVPLDTYIRPRPTPIFLDGIYARIVIVNLDADWVFDGMEGLNMSPSLATGQSVAPVDMVFPVVQGPGGPIPYDQRIVISGKLGATAILGYVQQVYLVR